MMKSAPRDRDESCITVRPPARLTHGRGARLLDCVNRAALASLLWCMLLAGAALADEPPSPRPASTGRLFGTDDAPPPGMAPSGPRVVMRLDYKGVAGCADEQVFRDVVATHVRRWDPFAPNAPWRLAVVVARRGAGYEGSVELRDVTGAVVLATAFPPTATCVGLLEDLAFSLALKIDPPRAPEGAVPPPEPPPPPASTPPPQAPPAPKAPATIAFRFGGGAWMDLATAPRPAFGMTVDAGFRVSWFSLAVEGRWDPPAGATVMDGVDVSTTRFMGALVPCGHYGWFFVCAVGEVGQIQGTLTATGKTTVPGQYAAPYGDFGARFGVEIPLAQHLSLRPAVNLIGAPRPPSFQLTHKLDHMIAWEAPAFTGGLGVGIGASF